MCGIAGICNFDGRAVERDSVKRMIALLQHRGPDDEGIYLSHTHNPHTELKVGLGHKRLSIIDIEGGHQPLCNEDETIWIVYNGEIYNFPTLREELIKKGHDFKTKTDTEVILHLYEEKGPDCVQHLRGMFAFCIWDERNERLFLARDRVGQKPFHYFYKNSSFIFASEIKALLQGDKITREIDFESLDCYLTYGYVFSPKTIFKGINKLPPAHTLTVDKYGMKLERYWKLTYKRKEILREEEYQNGLFSLLKEAVKIRLVSDVPLGAFLSGGIDSSTVAALMCMVSEEPVRTFTIGFKENDYNELVYAREVAMRLGTSHREFIVEPKAFELLPKLIWHYNEPFGDSSCIPTYYVANIARKFVTVALNGDGGDESFAGYERYRAVKLSMVMEKLPPWLLDFSSKMFEQFYWKAPVKSETRYLRHGAEFLKSVILHPNPYSRYLRWISIFKEDEKPSLYTEKLRRCINGYNPGDSFFKIIDESDAGEIVEKIMNADVVSYLPDDLLVKIDIASMANSLEARSPFLDHRLIEFAATMPLTMKLKGFHLKYILKKTMKDILPHKILHRRKMGFGVPVGKWFRGELKSYVYEILLGDRSIKRGYFNKDYVKHLIDEHISGKKNYERRIWALLNFELWHRMFIDNAH